MGRHKKSIERPCMPDVKYNSKVITKFVSRMMLDGKKANSREWVAEINPDTILEMMEKIKG